MSGSIFEPLAFFGAEDRSGLTGLRNDVTVTSTWTDSQTMAIELRPHDRFTLSPDVKVNILDGEAVLLDLQTGAYFGLNKVGAHIWQMYGEGQSVQQAIESVCQRFEVEAARAEQDARALTEKLVERGLLTKLANS
jgi:hypothetical protein